MTNSEADRLDRIESIIEALAQATKSNTAQLAAEIDRTQQRVEMNTQIAQQLLNISSQMMATQTREQDTQAQALRALNAALIRIDAFLDLLMATADRSDGDAL